MKRLLFIFLIYSLPSSAQKEEHHHIPDLIINNCDSLITSLVGKTYFAQYYQMSETSRYVPGYYSSPNDSSSWRMPKYSIFYNVNFTKEIKENNLLQIIVDTVGNIVSNNGIPDCLNFPSKCSFVRMDSILVVAKENKLPAGIKPWVKYLRWRNGFYVWEITSTTYENNGTTNGIAMSINANTGEFIGMDPVGGTTSH